MLIPARNSTGLRYALAATVVVAALAIRLALDPVLGQAQEFLIFTGAIALACRFSGRAPALAATALSVVLSLFFCVEPPYSMRVAEVRDGGNLAVLGVAGVLISLLRPRRPRAVQPMAQTAPLLGGTSLRRIGLFGATFSMLLVLTWILYSDFDRERDRQVLVSQTYGILGELSALTLSLESAKAAQGDNRYLHTFEMTLKASETASRAQRNANSAGRQDRERLDGLNALLQSKLAALYKPVPAGEAQAIIGTALDAVKATVETERRLLVSRSEEAESQAVQMRWVLGLGSWSLLLLLVMAGTVIERDHNTIQESEARLRMALEAAQAGTWEWDLRTNENRWSEESFRLYGLEPNSCQPSYEAWRQVVHPDDRDRAEQIVGEAARSGSDLHVEFRVAGSIGPRWLLALARPLRDQYGKPLRFIGLAVDITERKRAEDALREREQTLLRFTEAAPVAIAMFDRDMRYLAASTRFRSDYGLGDQELIGRSHYEVFPEIPERWREIHRRCLAGAVERNPGEMFERVSGDEQWIRWEIQPWRHPGGEIGGIVLFSEEITQQRRAEEAVRESEARLRLAQQVARIGTFEWNLQTGISTWTPELEIIHGLAPGVYSSRHGTWRGLLHPEDREDAEARVHRALETGALEAEWRVIWPSGDVRWLAARGTVFRDETGRPWRMIGVNIDITERRRTEAQALQWQRAFAEAELAIALSDIKTSTFRSVNDAFARQRGYTVEELEGSPIDAIFPERALGALRESIEIADRKGHASFESEHRRRDGSCFPILIDLTVLQDKAGQPVSRVAFVQDLTSQKEAEQQVHRLNAELEQRVRERTAQLEAANRELEAFSYSVSHDLRAPLRGIDGWSLALLEDYGPQLDAKGHNFLNRVRSETQRMGHLIDDLLQLSRITRSAMTSRPVDLSEIARNVAMRLQEENAARRIEFAIADGLSAVGDPRLLEVVLTNLLGNAAKFTSPRDCARIEFGESRSHGDRVFFVRDNGVGFDMAFAQMLFGAFQRLHSAAEFAGTGIGLATVQRIIHRHGGSVWAEAKPGQGATFFFRIGAPYDAA